MSRFSAHGRSRREMVLGRQPSLRTGKDQRKRIGTIGEKKHGGPVERTVHIRRETIETSKEAGQRLKRR